MQELDWLAIAERIINESGMCITAFYYAGRGALYEDFISEGTLTLSTIYDRMELLGKQSEFVKFVMAFNNLNAYDFINNFYFFARNGFKSEGTYKLKNHYMLKEPSIYRVIKSLLPEQEDETAQIKEAFKTSIEPKKKVYIKA